MTLIKLTDEHYIICDDSEIKEDCYALHEGPLGEREIVMANGQCKLDRRITHSTQPLEFAVRDLTPFGTEPIGYVYAKIQQLSLSEVKELTKTEWEYVGECKGNDDRCFMESPAHDCGCFKRFPKTSWDVEFIDGKLKIK